MSKGRIGIPLKDGEPTFTPNSKGLSCNVCGERVKRGGVDAHKGLHSKGSQRALVSASSRINAEIETVLLRLRAVFRIANDPFNFYNIAHDRGIPASIEHVTRRYNEIMRGGKESADAIVGYDLMMNMFDNPREYLK